MAEVVPLFHPERWLTAWEAIGGLVFLGEGPFGEAGAIVVSLLDLGPVPPPLGSARVRLQCLRGQLELSGAKAMVIDFLLRRQATRGEIGG